MRRLVLASLVVAAGCSSPSPSITITYDADLAAFLARPDRRPRTTTIRVIDAAAVGKTLGDRDPARGPALATCAELELARIPADVLAGATRTEVRGDATTLPDIPRVMDKLLVVEVAWESGVRLGLGCTSHGPIEDDRPIAVAVATSPRVIELTSNRDAAISGMVRLIATAPWSDAITIGMRDIEVERYHRGGRVEEPGEPEAMDTGDGVALITGLLADGAEGPLDPGPVLALIRVRGASAPLRVPQWQPSLPSTPTWTLDLAPAPGTVASWTAGIATRDGVERWTAIASYVDQAGVRRLRGYERDVGRIFAELSMPAPPGVPLIFDGRAWLLAADGWRRILKTEVEATALLPEAGGPAIEARLLVPCGARDDDARTRALVRRAPGAAYQVYARPGQIDNSTGLASKLGGRRLEDSICLGPVGGEQVQLLVLSDPRGQPFVATAGDGASNVDAALDSVTALADVTVRNSDAGPAVLVKRGLAAVVTERGPRVRSFRIAPLGPGPIDELEIIPTVLMDLPLAASPAAILAINLDGDDDPDDLVALVPTPAGPRLQIVMDDEIDGQPLSATSDLLPIGLGAAGRARLALVDTDAIPATPDELVVFTGEGLQIYQLPRSQP